MEFLKTPYQYLNDRISSINPSYNIGWTGPTNFISIRESTKCTVGHNGKKSVFLIWCKIEKLISPQIMLEKSNISARERHDFSPKQITY